jgi:hypothetical protein
MNSASDTIRSLSQFFDALMDESTPRACRVQGVVTHPFIQTQLRIPISSAGIGEPLIRSISNSSDGRLGCETVPSDCAIPRHMWVLVA